MEHQHRLSREPESNFGLKTELGEKTYLSKCYSERYLFACFQSISIFSHDTNIVAQSTRINLKDESSVIKLDATFDLEI